MNLKKIFTLIFVCLLISHSFLVVSAARKGKKGFGTVFRKAKKVVVRVRDGIANAGPAVGVIRDAVALAQEAGIGKGEAAEAEVAE
nr:venom polypeptide precursor [Doratifera vulnerans]